MIAKVCGITRLADALHAVQHGATAIGFVFWPSSPRRVSPGRAAAIAGALPATVTVVGVFVNQTVEEIMRVADAVGLRVIQLHGDEPASVASALGRPVWRALPLAEARASLAEWPDDTTILLDAHDPIRRGGTGRAIDWTDAAAIATRRPVVLAGGLTPENVEEAIATVRPIGVDVSSGVEQAPGVKDPDKVARFLARARGAFDAC